MLAYVVMVTPEASGSRVSSEAYKSLEAAQKFVMERSGAPEKLSEYKFRDGDYLCYEIFEVRLI
jgi:hypothetical protein